MRNCDLVGSYQLINPDGKRYVNNLTERSLGLIVDFGCE